MKIKLIVLILTSLYANAQINYGVVSYNVTVGTDEFIDTLDKTTKDSYIKDLESEKYTLEFDNKKSVFTYEGGLSPTGYTKSPKIYFRENDSLYLLRPEDNEDFGKLIVVENRNTKWELQNETKMIGEYKCYKATSTLVTDYGRGVFKFPIIAWYSPSIPVIFGPLGYGDSHA